MEYIDGRRVHEFHTTPAHRSICCPAWARAPHKHKHKPTALEISGRPASKWGVVGSAFGRLLTGPLGRVVVADRSVIGGDALARSWAANTQLRLRACDQWWFQERWLVPSCAIFNPRDNFIISFKES